MTVPPLAGVEAQALHLLTQAVAILRRRGVHNPEALLSHVVNRHIHPQPRRPEPVPFVVKEQARGTVELTPKQLAVLGEVAKGATHAETGERLGLTKRAVLSHMQRVAHRMGVRTGTQAVALVLRGQVQVQPKQGKRAA